MTVQDIQRFMAIEQGKEILVQSGGGGGGALAFNSSTWLLSTWSFGSALWVGL